MNRLLRYAYRRLKAIAMTIFICCAATAPSSRLAIASEYMTDLGTFGGDDSYAASINDSGQVVGYYSYKTGESHAFEWRNGHVSHVWGTNSTFAFDINNSG